MSHRCNRNFWDRREFLFRSGGGISGLALAYLLDRQGLLAAEQKRVAGGRWLRRCRRRREPVRGEAAALQAARDGRDLAVHGRRLEPGGYVRSEAGAGEVRRRADRRQGAGRRHRAPGISRAAHAQPLHVREVRAERDRGVGALSAPAPARRRDRVPALGVRAVERSRAGHLRDADRTDQSGISQCRLVGDLRPRIGRLEPARLRRHDRRARRAARRAERLERRIHSGRLSGDAIPFDRRSDRRSEAAGRHDGRFPAGAPRRAGEAERAGHAEVSRQQRAGGADLLVRARLSHAGMRARRRGRRE